MKYTVIYTAIYKRGRGKYIVRSKNQRPTAAKSLVDYGEVDVTSLIKVGLSVRL